MLELVSIIACRFYPNLHVTGSIACRGDGHGFSLRGAASPERLLSCLSTRGAASSLKVTAWRGEAEAPEDPSFPACRGD